MGATEFPNEHGGTPISKHKWLHRQKMERKELDRYERGMRRTMEWERRKVQAPWMIERERKWLKSPYAFRRGGL